MTEPMLPPKQDIFRALLQRGSVFVHLDPRTKGVKVPERLLSQPQAVLQFGLDMPVPIPDMVADSEGISATLAFNRQSYFCVIPWSSVFALVGEDAKGMVYPNEIPAEVKEALESNIAGVQKRAPKAAKVFGRPQLRLIKSEPSKGVVDSQASDKPKNRSHLRLVTNNLRCV